LGIRELFFNLALFLEPWKLTLLKGTLTNFQFFQTKVYFPIPVGKLYFYTGVSNGGFFPIFFLGLIPGGFFQFLPGRVNNRNKINLFSQTTIPNWTLGGGFKAFLPSFPPGIWGSRFTFPNHGLSTLTF